jgi:drug/metabolite transporter (DMT)-like permease
MLGRMPWRAIGWGGAAALLALPFLAMQFTNEVVWTASDFVAIGVMLLMVGIPLEVAVRMSPSWSYRAGAALALLGAFLTVWANLAVGIVGSNDNPANLLFFGALLIGGAGAIVARFRARGTDLAMAATAAALGVAFVIAVSGPTDEPNVPHWRELIGTSAFAALFLASSALFCKASRARPA